MLTCILGIVYLVVAVGWPIIAFIADNRKMKETLELFKELDQQAGIERSPEEYFMAYCHGYPFELPVSYWIVLVGGAIAVTICAFLGV